MLKKTRNIALMGAALAAISFGGSALASAGAAPVSPTQKASAARVAIADAGQPDAVNDKETADRAEGASDKETADGPETGSEVAEDDGPGHADEPGNPNAEHEASGQE